MTEENVNMQQNINTAKEVQKEKIPIGMIILMVWFVWGAISSFFSLMSYYVFSYNMPFWFYSPLLYLSHAILYITAFFVVYKRIKWGWQYIVFLNIFAVLYSSVVSYLMFMDPEKKIFKYVVEMGLKNYPGDKTQILNQLNPVMGTMVSAFFVFSMLIALAIAIVVCVYVIRKRKYFIN